MGSPGDGDLSLLTCSESRGDPAKLDGRTRVLALEERTTRLSTVGGPLWTPMPLEREAHAPATVVMGQAGDQPSGRGPEVTGPLAGTGTAPGTMAGRERDV
eukprot:CAMPEP_0194528872 /NCGR_PEP_ID=MMETSP0253-20130528/65377_1 /TAXON_ID=2966 /ORGANISM="Noctiluca scintillans" /LENGTH=100 /DNA_ID=CAMNT_0039373961 /DNA_START=1012 /DNA_END=1311 /DNA_ORIENTATION=-